MTFLAKATFGSATRRVALLATGVAVLSLLVAAPASADQQPTVVIGDVTVSEGDSGTTSAVFSISLTQAVPTRTTVTYATADSSAKSPGDYAYAGGQLIFAPGATTKTVAVDVVGDTRYEGDEAFSLYISSPSGALVPDTQGVATIVDDDGRPYVSVDDTSVVEGDTGTVDAVFPVTLDHASSNTIRVRYRTTTGTASADDYRFTTGTLTFAPGQTSTTVAVPVVGDTIDEGNSEYLRLYVSAPQGAQLLANNYGIGTIFDDDGTPSISITDSAVVEGNSGTANLVFKVSLSSASPNTVTSYYGTTDGSATSADYTARFGTLQFTPGQLNKTITVPVIGDTLDEANAEYLNMYLQNVSGATVSDGQAYGEIVDDDPALSAVSFLTVDTATVKEGNTGTVNEVFKVLLQPAAAAPVTVNYATSASSATAGVDYTTTSGTLTIPTGSTSANVSVPVKGDVLIEGDEQFGLSLSGATNATIDDTFAYGVIVDDDAPPVVSISDATLAEGDTGTGDAAFEIDLSGPSPVVVSVAYGTNNSSATAPSDYVTASGTVTFQPGETTKVVHVTTNGDTTDENDEQFYVYLSSPVNATVTDNYGYAVIVDDDRNPALSISDSAVYEGTTGSIQATLTVTMDAPSPNTVTVNYATSNGTAVAPDDYTATSGTLTFAPGQTSATWTVAVQSDTVDEGSEYVYLGLSSAANATLQDSSGYLYILDDDTRPTISIDDASVVEPNTGTATVTLRVTLSAASANTVTVNYATSNGSATSPGDYTAVGATLTFNPGETVKTISVPVVGDTISEPNEYFYMSLSSPTAATVQDSYGYATIFDNDPLPYLTINESAVVEGNSGTKNGTLMVTLSPASPNSVTVAYTTSDGSAVAGSDYVATSGTLTFAPGQTSKTVTTTVNGDTTDENNEYFALTLSAPTNAGLLDSTGYITIFDDDPTGTGSLLTVDDTSVLETDTGTTNATFTVTLVPAAASQVTVNYNTSNNSAVAGADYAPQAGTLTFAPGQTSATVTVPVNGDTLDEGEERFFVSLFSATGPVSVAEPNAYGVIIDNDRSPVITIGDATVDEGNTGTVDAAFTVSLTAASPQPVYVDWDTRDSSAVAPGDYLDDGGSLVFAPGETSKVVHVTVNGDNLVEGDEIFYVDLSGLVGGTYGTSDYVGTGTILDSDAYALLGSVTDTAGAGIGGTTLTLSGNSRPAMTTTTAADGSYAFDNVVNGRYVLTPTAPGRTFAPASYTADVRGGSLSGLTFISLAKPSVSGQIVDAAGNPVPGVTVTRSGNSQPNSVVVTNGMGYYGFSANPAGTYNIKPTKSGTTFTPAAKNVTLAANSALTTNFAKN